MEPQGSKSTVAERMWSLRREWSRAFFVVLIVIVLVAVGSIIGVRGVVGEVQGNARQLHDQSVTVARLRVDVVLHEELGHKLLSAAPADRTLYLRQQRTIGRLFEGAIASIPATHGLRETVVAAHLAWQQGLREYGLWAPNGVALQGNHSAENPLYGASSDHVVALLDSLEGPSLAAMDEAIHRGNLLETWLTAGLAGLFGVMLAATFYYRRRMSRDLVRPLESLHDAVLKLRSGD